MKNIFSLKLYLFGMRHLKIIGFIALFSTLLLNVVYLITEGHTTKLTADLLAPMCLALGAFAPFFVYFSFSYFEEKRGQNLFYGLPAKRFSFFSSFSLAIYTWIFSIILVCCMVNTAIYSLIFDTDFFFDKYFWNSVLYYVSTCGLLTSIFIFAKSVTSKVYTWLIVAVILIVFPVKFADEYVLNIFIDCESATQFALFGNVFDVFRSPLDEIPRDLIGGRIGLFAVEAVLLFALSCLFFFLKKTRFFSKTAVITVGKCFFTTLALAPFVVDSFNYSWESRDITKRLVFKCMLIAVVALIPMIIENRRLKNILISCASVGVSFAVSFSLVLFIPIFAKNLDRVNYTLEDIDITALGEAKRGGFVYTWEDYPLVYNSETDSMKAKEIIYNALTDGRDGTSSPTTVLIVLKDGRSEYRRLNLEKDEFEALMKIYNFKME